MISMVFETRPSSFADQVYGRILDEILSGAFAPGSRLPGENDLSERFGVSRPVVRQALARLHADGLVEARRGSGTYVLSRPSDNLTDVTSLTDVSRFLRYQELRLSIEGEAAALAAARRTEKALSDIARAHERFAQQIGHGTFDPESDRAFHLAILDATGNEFFRGALEGNGVALSDFMGISLSITRSGSTDRARKVVSEHTDILEAIRMRDAVWARAAMEQHIIHARRRLTDRTLDP
jgi:GntR family transcriptional repressor for pyruvate dehydrogenase complex